MEEGEKYGGGTSLSESQLKASAQRPRVGMISASNSKGGPPPATKPAKKKSNGHEWIEAEREAMSEKQRALWVAKKKSKKA